MKFKADITIMPLKELLDPQGKAVMGGLKNLKFSGIENVRIGKHIVLEVEAADESQAKAVATDACKKLLANAVMEHFEVSIAAN